MRGVCTRETEKQTAQVFRRDDAFYIFKDLELLPCKLHSIKMFKVYLCVHFHCLCTYCLCTVYLTAKQINTEGSEYT